MCWPGDVKEKIIWAECPQRADPDVWASKNQAMPLSLRGKKGFFIEKKKIKK